MSAASGLVRSLLLGMVCLCWLSLAMVAPNKVSPIQEPEATLFDTTRLFTESWLVEDDQQRALSYASKDIVCSDCIAQQLREAHQPLSRESAELVVADYLGRVRREIKKKVHLTKSTSLSDVIEPLPIANADAFQFLTTSGPEGQWYSIIRLDLGSAGSFACDDAEVDWLTRKLGEGRALYAQVYKVKNVPEGEIVPLAFIWQREDGAWKVLTVGAVGF